MNGYSQLSRLVWMSTHWKLAVVPSKAPHTCLRVSYALTMIDDELSPSRQPRIRIAPSRAWRLSSALGDGESCRQLDK